METEEGLCSDRGFLGDRARLLQCLHHAHMTGFRGHFEKRWLDRLLYATIFKRILDIIRIKIRHLKSENKWESLRRFDLNGPDIEVH